MHAGTGADGLLRPQLDLAVLSKAALMIGHCPSSFTAVAAKMREAKGMPTAYWGLPLGKSSGLLGGGPAHVGRGE